MVIRTGLHWDNEQRTEWVVVSVRATGLISLFHLACYLTTHLIGRAAGLPVPRGLYFLFHDWAEPPLRRWCERHPNQHWQPDGR